MFQIQLNVRGIAMIAKVRRVDEKEKTDQNSYREL